MTSSTSPIALHTTESAGSSCPAHTTTPPILRQPHHSHEPSHLKPTPVFETALQQVQSIPWERLSRSNFRWCIPLYTSSARLDSVHRRHIRLLSRNHVCTTLDNLIFVQHLLLKRFLSIRQRRIEAHSINISPDKPSVVWKYYTHFSHWECPSTLVYHQLPSLA